MGYGVARHDVIQNGRHLGFFQKIRISQNGVEISRNATEGPNGMLLEHFLCYIPKKDYKLAIFKKRFTLCYL